MDPGGPHLPHGEAVLGEHTAQAQHVGRAHEDRDSALFDEGPHALAEALVTEEKRYEVDGIFLLRENIAAEQLVPGLAMDGNHIAVNLQMETNLPGCFACGDVAGKPYQYIKAAGQGNVAALSAVDYLNKNKL